MDRGWEKDGDFLPLVIWMIQHSGGPRQARGGPHVARSLHFCGISLSLIPRRELKEEGCREPVDSERGGVRRTYGGFARNVAQGTSRAIRTCCCRVPIDGRAYAVVVLTRMALAGSISRGAASDATKRPRMNLTAGDRRGEIICRAQ